MAKLIHILIAALLAAGVSLAAVSTPSASSSVGSADHGVGSGMLHDSSVELPAIRDATDLFVFLESLGQSEWAADADGNQRLDHRDVAFFIASFDRPMSAPDLGFESPLHDLIQDAASFANATSPSSERRSNALASPDRPLIASSVSEPTIEAQLARVDPRDGDNRSSRGPPAA